MEAKSQARYGPAGAAGLQACVAVARGNAGGGGVDCCGAVARGASAVAHEVECGARGVVKCGAVVARAVAHEINCGAHAVALGGARGRGVDHGDDDHEVDVAVLRLLPLLVLR